MNKLVIHVLVSVACFWLPAESFAQDGNPCGPVSPKSPDFPWDYRVKSHHQPLVERAHFTAQVEMLVRGQSGQAIEPDLDYTLNHIPNHHRALIALHRLAERSRADQLPYMKYTVECYFERAVRFTPDDLVARQLYAAYLHSKQRDDDAVRQLNIVTDMADDNPFTHYNVGLLFLQMKRYADAVRQAQKAEELGFRRTELKNRLVGLGQWPMQPSGAASAASQ